MLEETAGSLLPARIRVNHTDRRCRQLRLRRLHGPALHRQRDPAPHAGRGGVRGGARWTPVRLRGGYPSRSIPTATSARRFWRGSSGRAATEGRSELKSDVSKTTVFDTATMNYIDRKSTRLN